MRADIRFIFEWAITLFKTGKLKEAGEKAYQAFTRNTYLFLCRPVTPIHKWEGSNLESVDFAEKFPNYSKDEDHLADFTEWFKHYDPEFSTYGNDGV